MNGLDKLYINIGEKIKNLATWIFVLEAVITIIIGILVIAQSYGSLTVIICGVAITIIGPFLSLLSTWLLYGIGVLIEKACQIEQNTRRIERNK